MALVKFNCNGSFADVGKAGEQFEHEVDEICDVSPQCAQAAVGYGMAEHVTEKPVAKPGPKKADKPGPKKKSEKNPAKSDKEASES